MFLCLGLLDKDVLCQIQQPKRGKAAVTFCPQVQPIVSLKMYFQHVHAECTYTWHIYINTYIHGHTDHRQTCRAVTQTQAEPTDSSCSHLSLSGMEVCQWYICTM